MPGMMDTVLDLGLNDVTVEALAKASGDARFAWDSYRRFIQIYGDVALGVDHYLFEDALEIAKEDNGFFTDVEMEAQHWKALVSEYKASSKPKPARLSRRMSMHNSGAPSPPSSTAGTASAPAPIAG
jgi:phosphoenolpyruvate synthase/pyruvate phosphate dikinase